MKAKLSSVCRAGAPPAVIGIGRVASVALALQLLFAVSAHGIGGGFTNHIYGANIGWIFTGISGGNGPVIGQFYCTGFVSSANCGWVSFCNPGGPGHSPAAPPPA